MWKWFKMNGQEYYIYLLTNTKNKMIRVGMINDGEKKIFEEQGQFLNSFIKEHKINKLVYFETVPDVKNAIEREHELKSLRRSEKNKLIETMNPKWDNLIYSLIK